jgi:serine/threonine protein phosphatase PrpC
MGNLLGTPITEKETHVGEIDELNYGVSSMQGWRIHMEDAHICQETLCAQELLEDNLVTNNDSSSSNNNNNNGNSNNDEEDEDSAEEGGQMKKARVSSNTNLKEEAAATSPPITPAASKPTYKSIPMPQHSLFAVFDGHGGSFAAHYSGLNFVRVLSRQPSFVKYAYCLEELNGNGKDAVNGTANAENDNRSPQVIAKLQRQALQWLEMAFGDAFIEIDTEIYHAMAHYPLDPDVILPPKTPSPTQDEEADASPLLSASDSGTTANVVLFTPQWILCANAGDSRSVYSKSMSGNQITTPLSYDHKPEEDAESQRIQDAGGFVRAGRVDGDLAVSRGLGDFRFKNVETVLKGTTVHKHSFKYKYGMTGGKASEEGDHNVGPKRQPQNGGGGGTFVVTCPEDQKVSPVPDLVIQNRNRQEDEFVVVACDGIWDVVTNQECVDLTREIFQGGESDLGLLSEEVRICCISCECVE